MRSQYIFRFEKDTLLLLVSILLAFQIIPAKSAKAAGSASFVLSPNASTYKAGDNVSVRVSVDSGGETINAVQADMTYDSARLSFVGIDTSSGKFPTCAPTPTGGGGSINIACAVLGEGLKGSQDIAVINFTAEAEVSTAKISIADSAAIVAQTPAKDIWNGEKTSATITLTGQQAPVPAPTPSPNPPSGPTAPANTTQSNPLGKPSVVGVQFTRASVVGEISRPLKVFVEYKEKSDDPQKAIFKTTPVDATGKYQIAIDGDSLKPGATYQYQVIGVEAGKDAYKSEVAFFTTRGYSIRIAVKTKEGGPAKNAIATMHSEPKNGRTDDNGVITFNDVSYGDHELFAQLGQNTIKTKITVANSMQVVDGQQTAVIQDFQVTLEPATGPFRYAAEAAIVGIAIILTGIISLIRKRIRHKKLMRFKDIKNLPKITPAQTDTTVVHPMDTAADEVKTEPVVKLATTAGKIIQPLPTKKKQFLTEKLKEENTDATTAQVVTPTSTSIIKPETPPNKPTA